MLGRRRGAHTSYSPYRAGLHGPRRTGRDPGVQLTELSRKEGADAVSLGPTLEPPSAASNAKATGTLKRPTSLSRHASAAGFPLSGASSWTLSRGHRSPLAAASPAELPIEGPCPDTVEDISHLLTDVARFAKVLEKLKECVLSDDLLEARRPLAHEYLGETLRVMRQVISKYPLLNTVETLTAAGSLIAKIRGFHYECNNESDKQEFEKALETIAVSFSNTVSEFLMGEVDSSTLLSVPPGDPSQTMENLYGPGGEGAAPSTDDCEAGCLAPEEVDMLLQRCEGGVDAALQYAKNMARYMKDLIGYLEKRTALEMDFAKGLQKIVHNCRQSFLQEPHMPLLSIYSLALEQDLEFGHCMVQAVSTLQTQTLMQPLNLRRLEHEKRRKEIKESWHRAQRKLQEAESNLRKAKQGYTQRCEDHGKARFLAAKAEEEQAVTGPGAAASKTLDKRRRLEEEAKNKAEEAMATYRTCVADAKTQKQELEDTKVTVLRQIQEVIRQTDQTIKSATISYYQMLHMQTASLPVHFQMLCESSKLYDPGQQYASHVGQLQRDDEPNVRYDFEPHVSTNAWSPVMRTRKGSLVGDTTGAEATGSPEEEGGPSDGMLAKERRGGRGHQVHKSWPTTMSDSESVLDPGPGSEDLKKLQRMSSSGTMSSSEELVDQEGSAGASAFEQADLNGMAPELPVAMPSGPFRNMGLSKAARTHRLRKLRTPAKCRECNSYVYFQGAECEECCLACHKKCLDTLAIQCGHKKLQGRLQLFGQDFAQAARSTPDGVPFIIKKCVCEIEQRALHTKGIYRVNGVKTRVEKLCQAFENGKELVELSQASPHDISNVLKLYLRQLPEPIISFRLYHELVGLAKDSLKAEAEAKAASRGRPDAAESEVHKSWPTTMSDSESVLDPGPGSEDLKKLQRMSSSGTMSSSEELVDQEGSAGASAFEQADLNGMAPELPVAMPSGPFRNMGLSKAARTHRLRKLRTPAKCRECNSYVYFQGAECEEARHHSHLAPRHVLGLLLEDEAIVGDEGLHDAGLVGVVDQGGQGHRGLGGPWPQQCGSEHNAQVPRSHLVVLLHLHDPSGHADAGAAVSGPQAPPGPANLAPCPAGPHLRRCRSKYCSVARFSGGRSCRSSRSRPAMAVAAASLSAASGRPRDAALASASAFRLSLASPTKVEQDNKMTPGNLGIVFGPTLLRPRPTEATVSLSSLVDYPHQARVVETLIAHYGLIFEEEPEDVPGGQDGVYAQRAEAVVQVPYPEASVGDAFPLQEEAVDGGPESRVASNDSDSEVEEASDLLSPADRGAAHHLSFLEKQGSEASVEEGQGSRSGSEERLGAAAGEAGDGEGLAQQLSEYNANQCNNVAEVRLPAMRLRGGRVEAASGQDRQPEFV
ncbi:rho GTPase-activating protein 45 [Ursus maritimus]|uniref:Rho GTPase-activating protein 45 n=1 Tax=Ursus maritimus TaxID=29073 RepID=A0A8M1FVB7_URSMA|nr:rho GTPase-activating protein 45 [Ursus maritimus]